MTRWEMHGYYSDRILCRHFACCLSRRRHEARSEDWYCPMARNPEGTVGPLYLGTSYSGYTELVQRMTQKEAGTSRVVSGVGGRSGDPSSWRATRGNHRGTRRNEWELSGHRKERESL